jgi:hypothetical protein
MAKRDELRGEDRLLHPKNEGHDEERARAQRRDWAEEEGRGPAAGTRPGTGGTGYATKAGATSRSPGADDRHFGAHPGRQSGGGEPKKAGKHDENSGYEIPVGAGPALAEPLRARHHTGTKPQATTGEAQRRRHPPEE